MMKTIKDQSDVVKMLQFKKFFPEVWKSVAEELKNIGTKTSREPPSKEKKALVRMSTIIKNDGNFETLKRKMTSMLGSSSKS